MAEENNENNKDMFAVDEALGTIMGAKGPKLVDTKNIDDEWITTPELEKK